MTKATMRSLFAFAGEHSGDLHGGALLGALRGRQPNLHMFGVGGPEMQAQGLSVHLPMEQFQVFGFTDILAKFPRLWGQFRQTHNLIQRENPDCVLLIDYPGFNLRLARVLRQKGYRGKIVQYISPTVWAWGRGRIQKLADSADLLLTIFPFEPPLFSHTKLKVRFVGHPLIERIQRYSYHPHWYSACGIQNTEKILAVFPGSRTREIQRLFPRQMASAIQLRQYDPSISILVSCTHESQRSLLEQEIRRAGQTLGRDVVLVPKHFTYELMQSAHIALAKSGTVTLELALHGKPTVVVYDISMLNTLIARYILGLKLPHYCIVNILCGRTIFPEFIEQSFTAVDLYHALQQLHIDGPERRRCLTGCQEARQALLTASGDSASDTAALAIEELF